MQLSQLIRPAQGQTVAGDAVRVLHHGATTVIVCDGLGHGPPAHDAAQAFCRFVEDRAGQTPEQILLAASSGFAHSRGLAAALLSIDEAAGKLAFAGIGNIELHARSRAVIRPISLPGIVGRSLRKVLPFEYELSAGDTFVVHTDGISSRFELADYVHLDTAPMAEAILAAHGKFHDDATCVVIRI